MLEIERGSTRSHCVENSICKMLWTCCKTDGRMNEEVRPFDRREWVPVMREARAKLKGLKKKKMMKKKENKKKEMEEMK
jgi:hypothetical protein